MKLKSLLSLSFAALLTGVLVSCGDDRHVTCGDVTYIKEFPTEVTLDKTEPWMDDMIGTVSVKGIDTIMIGIAWNERYTANLYSTVSGEKLADIFPKGQGPGEYYTTPTLRKLKSEGDSCYGVFRYNDHLFTLNLTATAETGREVKSDLRYPSRMEMMRDQLPLDNGDTLVIYRRQYDTGGFDRAIRGASGEKEITSLGSVSDEWQNIDSNALGIIPVAMDGDSLIAEGMIQLNQIVVYSPYDESVRKTVCVGDRLSSIPGDSFIDRLNRLRAYGGSQKVGDKVAFLYHGMGEWDYENNDGASELQIFDSKMNPVTRIKFPHIVEAFFIDSRGNLFGFTTTLGESESVFKWDISRYL